MLVKVHDNVPPVPVCDETTTIAVSIDGHAVLHAESLDGWQLG